MVTTLGYGDYSGGTTLELLYSLLLMFFGLLVFATMETAVRQVVHHDPSYTQVIINVDHKITLWLLALDSSSKSTSLPADLYSTVRQELWRSFVNDHRLIIDEFSFYQELTPKMQDELIQVLFGDFIATFEDFFTGLERQFINSMVVTL